MIAQVWAISIHALREEGDSAKKYNSAEAAAISIHALREEGDGDYFGLPTNIGNISIHALREEGDLTPLLFLLVFFFLFLSTPSARRATALPRLSAEWIQISIHALREEGDQNIRMSLWGGFNFYPRPPRGGRQQKQRQNLYFQTNYTTFCTNLEEP